MSAAWMRVAELEDVPEGRPCRVVAGGRPLVLVRRGGEVRACDAVCPHKYGDLGEGELEGGMLRCPLHEARFDLQTGLPDEAWAGRLPVFEARVSDGGVEVWLD